MKQNNRPLCDCGEELYLHKRHIEHSYYIITLDGNRKSKKYHDDDLVELFEIDDTLICDCCMNEYKVGRENNMYKRLDKIK